MSKPHLPVIERLDARYRFEHVLGEGAVGRVVRAAERDTDTPVAIKTLHPHLADQADARARFLREARILNSLHHPNIVRGLDLGVDAAGHPFLVMELIEGQQLDEAWADASLGEAIGWFRQALAGLAYLHRRGLVHRDVKPANIVVAPTPDGQMRVILLDLGLVTGSEAADVGTPTYMAPEQVQGHNTGPPADVYACGVILFELLTGAPPFKGAHGIAVALQQVEAPIPPLVLRPELEVPPALVDVVRLCLAKAPDERYADATALERALGQAMGAGEVLPLVTAAASQISRIVGAAVRRESAAPEAVGPDVWTEVMAFTNGDAAFGEALVAHLIELGVAQDHGARVGFARTPRPERWPKTLEALKVEQVEARLSGPNARLHLRLLVGLALVDGEVGARGLQALGETLGVNAQEALTVLEAAGAVCWVGRRLRLADAELGLGLRKRALRSKTDGPPLHRAVARALAISEGAARAELIARLFVAGGAYMDAASFLHRASADTWAAGKHGEAIALLEQSVRQMIRADTSASTQRAASLRLELAERLRAIGDVAQGVRIAQEVVASAEAARAPAVAGRAWSILAEVDRELGQLGEAIEGFEAAAAAFAAGGAFEAAATALVNEAAVARAAKAPHAARDLYLRADAMLPGDASLGIRISIRRGLGEAFLRLGEAEEAVGPLLHARALAEELDDPNTAAACDWLLGEAHRLQGQLEPARVRLGAAAVAYQRTAELAGEARARTSLARVMAALGQPEMAATAYDRAMHLCRRLGHGSRVDGLLRERRELAVGS